MKIQSVRIKNFRALKDVTIPFDSVTTFIGPNGAGKSTVLRALDWFFNGKPGSLTGRNSTVDFRVPCSSPRSFANRLRVTLVTPIFSAVAKLRSELIILEWARTQKFNGLIIRLNRG
jgi:predicted ATP-dependent endonuclease of OLD family